LSFDFTAEQYFFMSYEFYRTAIKYYLCKAIRVFFKPNAKYGEYM